MELLIADKGVAVVCPVPAAGAEDLRQMGSLKALRRRGADEVSPTSMASSM